MAFSPLESLFSLCTLRSLCPLCKILCFFSGRPPHWLVHIRQPARSRLFTHFRPRPTLPVWPPWDSPGFRINFCEPPRFFVPSLPSSPQWRSPNNCRKPKSPNPSRRQKKLLKTPHKSNCSKPASALRPTGTAAKKSTHVYTSTTNSACASSPASISTTTAHLNRSKSLSSTSPIRAAAPPTSCPAPSPTIPILPSSTPRPTTTSASNPSASSALSPATLSNTASSLPFRTIPWPPTSGSIIPSTARALSPKSISRLFYPPLFLPLPHSSSLRIRICDNSSNGASRSRQAAASVSRQIIRGQ